MSSPKKLDVRKTLSSEDCDRLEKAYRMMQKYDGQDYQRVIYGNAGARCEESRLILWMLDWNPHTGIPNKVLMPQPETVLKWGGWLHKCVAAGDVEALYRLTVFLGALHGKLPDGAPNKKHPEQRLPDQVSKKELKLKNSRGRPAENFHAFARAAMAETFCAWADKRLVRASAIRKKLPPWRRAICHTGTKMHSSEFSRCIAHFKLKGLIQGLDSGPRTGTRQLNTRGT